MAAGRDNSSDLNPSRLSAADYIRAEAQLTVEQKSALATHLALALNSSSSDGAHFADAEAILRLLIWNAEPDVVQAMATAVARNPNAPKSIAWALANDDEEVAAPVLETCTALTDADLVALVEETTSFLKMGAIAKRPAVSEQLSRSLVHHGDESAIELLLANAKAVIPDDAVAFVLDRYGQRTGIQRGLASRAAASPAGTPAAAAPAPAAPVPIPGYTDSTDEEMDRRISQMIADKALDESTLLRHVCLGNYVFFCRALAALSGSSGDDVCRRLLPSAFAQLPELWERTSLSAAWLPLTCAAIDALIQIDGSNSKADRELFSRNVVDRTIAAVKSKKIVLTDAQRRFFAHQRKR